VTCQDCGGCTYDNCSGGCGERWCHGTYMGEGCDRCPEKVDKQITVNKLRDRRTVPTQITIKVRCNDSDGHTGRHHWNPWLAGR
jgi:hypothetical protein